MDAIDAAIERLAAEVMQKTRADLESLRRSIAQRIRYMREARK
jgi:hypothetical protein